MIGRTSYQEGRSREWAWLGYFTKSKMKYNYWVYWFINAHSHMYYRSCYDYMLDSVIKFFVYSGQSLLCWTSAQVL